MSNCPHQESQQSQIQSGHVYASMILPDDTRSPTGAWLLPHNLEPCLQEFRSPDRTEAQCWELAGATWDETFYTRNITSDCIISVLDPEKTKLEVTDDGATFLGGWKVLRSAKREALRLKERNQQWAWSRCFEEVGAEWDIWREFRSELSVARINGLFILTRL